MLLITFASLATAALPPHHPQHHAPASLLNRIARSNPASLSGGDASASSGLYTSAGNSITSGSVPQRRPFSAGLRVTPSSFGGDPTGQKDSWAALNAALQHCLNQSALSPNGFFPGQATTPSFGQC
jgi:hypothetical protein